MASSKMIEERGWFYHAPSKRADDRPMVSAPPPSQIPGLSHGLPDTSADENQPKMWIKETDSPYTILAKQGGRADLLRYKSPKPRSEEPQGYPRCDWYYHDDILATENQPAKNNDTHEFLLPDYMVHSEWPGHKKTSPSESGDTNNKRTPYSYTQDTVFSRESNPTDKTVKLPELTPSGYGVRNEKSMGRQVKQAPISRREPIIPQGELSVGSAKYKPVPRIEPTDATLMGRLMSHGYNDRESQHSAASKHHKVEDQFEASTRLHAERMHSGSQHAAPGPCNKMAAAGMVTKRGEQEFKKVQARTNSHRSQMHGHNPIVHDLEPIEPTAARRRPQPVM